MVGLTLTLIIATTVAATAQTDIEQVYNGDTYILRDQGINYYCSNEASTRWQTDTNYANLGACFQNTMSGGRSLVADPGAGAAAPTSGSWIRWKTSTSQCESHHGDCGPVACPGCSVSFTLYSVHLLPPSPPESPPPPPPAAPPPPAMWISDGNSQTASVSLSFGPANEYHLACNLHLKQDPPELSMPQSGCAVVMSPAPVAASG